MSLNKELNKHTVFDGPNQLNELSNNFTNHFIIMYFQEIIHFVKNFGGSFNINSIDVVFYKQYF